MVGWQRAEAAIELRSASGGVAGLVVECQCQWWSGRVRGGCKASGGVSVSVVEWQEGGVVEWQSEEAH